MVQSGLDFSIVCRIEGQWLPYLRAHNLCAHPGTWGGPASLHVEGNLLVLHRTTFSPLFAFKCPSGKQVFIGNLIPIITLLMRKHIKVFFVASCIRRNDSYACCRNVWKDCIYLCHHLPTPPPSIMPLLIFSPG